MEIIGIDHGYAQMKGTHFVFKSGLTTYKHEPPSMHHVLQYDGTYYACGSSRQALVADKTADDRYYLLTLAAIAEEIKARGLPKKTSIPLAAGLPLTRYGRERDAFSSYLKRTNKPVRFLYEGEDYQVTISDVMLFPQGFAAVAGMKILNDEPVFALLDIGGWTLDACLLIDARPDAETCYSHDLGVIRLFTDIKEQIRRETGSSINEAQIEHFLLGRTSKLKPEIKEIIQQSSDLFAARILSTLNESMIDTSNTPMIFIGGGSLLLKESLLRMVDSSFATFIDDVHANAKGYEYIAYEMQTRP